MRKSQSLDIFRLRDTLKREALREVMDALPEFSAAEIVKGNAPILRKQRRAQRQMNYPELADVVFRMADDRRCRICGCSELNCSGCVMIMGEPCCWANASHTLCSACEMG